MRFFSFCLRVASKLAVLISGTALLLSVTLLVVATTIAGRLFAAAAVCVFAILLTLALCMARKRRPGHPAFIASSAVIALALVVVCRLGQSTDANLHAQSGLVSVGSEPGWLGRFTPAQLVPERDQVRLGSYVLPLVDPFMSFAQAKRFRELFATVYQDMQGDPAFVRVGSVLGQAYADILPRRHRQDHWYIYYPRSLRSAPGARPTIVFCHGWLGNMKCYMWLLRQLAEEHRMVIVCPTFGAGFWNRPAAIATLRRTFELCRQDARIDETRLVLAGLSNGGMAVTHAALQFPECVRAMLYVSPILEANRLAGCDVIRNQNRTPILVIHGEDDRRIPKTYVEEQVNHLMTSGWQVERRCYAASDHLLFLSAFGQLREDFRQWLRASGFTAPLDGPQG